MIKMKASEKASTNFNRFLISLILVVIVIICLLSVTLYINFEASSLSIIYTFIEDGLDQISNSAHYMTESTRTLLYQLFNGDSIVGRLLFDTVYLDDGSIESLEMWNMLEHLRNYTYTSPFIHSIYLYNSNEERFYFSRYGKGEGSAEKNSFHDREIADMIDHISNYKNFEPIPRKIEAAEERAFYVYTYLLYGTYENISEKYNVVIVNISEDRLRNIIRSMQTNPDDNIFIIDKNGMVILGTEDSQMLSDISGYSYIQKIIKSTASSDYFVDDINGIPSLVTFVSSPSLDWKFVRVTEYSQVASKLNNLKNTSLLICVLALVGGIILAFYLSRRLYKPINNILNEWKLLKKERMDNMYTMKQQLLKYILLHDSEQHIAQVKSKFQTYNIKLDPEGSYALLILMIDNFKDFCNRYNLDDRNLLKFGIMNIASEIVSSRFINETVDTDSDHMTVILNIPGNDLSDIRQELSELSKKIQDAVQSYMGISLSVFVSTSGQIFNEVCALYNSTIRITSQRLFYGHGCTVFMDDMKNEDFPEYTYPAKKAKLMIDTLMLGKIQEAKEIFCEIIDNAIHYPVKDLRGTILRLAFAINTTIEMLEKNNDLTVNYHLSTFISELDDQETLDEIKNLFFTIFDNISLRLEEKKSGKHNTIASQIMDIIKNDYLDKNLTLEHIADRVGMSPSYLRRLFKKITNQSVADYINEVRLEKAKELLINTNFSINEISEKSGFVNSCYFYTLFKKTNGMTPNEFREKKETLINQV